MSNTFTFTGKLKRTLLLLMLAGAVFIGVGALTFGSGGSHGDDHGSGHGEAHGQEAHTDPATTNLHDAAAEATHGEEAAAAHADSIHPPMGEEAHTEYVDSHTDKAHADDAHGAGAHGADAAHGHDEHHAEAHPASLKTVIAANFWTVTMYFLWIAIAAMFFLAAHTIGWAGWHIMIQKVSVSIMTLIPVMAVIGAILFIVAGHDIFEWTHRYLFDPADERYDALLATKEQFLNVKSFTILGILWVGILTALMVSWWNKLKKQDVDPDLKHFRSSRTLAAVSIVLVAIINAFGVWHWIMSIEPHWYSTLFAWYTMASAAAGMFAFTILVTMILQSMGYLKNVNENHYHDLGKYLFAISVFWTYLWFSQFMLIWYANIPEETIYFSKRMGDYPGLFYGSFIINFLLPFFVLLKRVSKRNKGVLIFMCIMLILGHWFDFFNSIVVPLVPSGGMGLISIGSLLLFTGFAGFVVFTALSRVKDLESSEHPYYKESLIHHI